MEQIRKNIPKILIVIALIIVIVFGIYYIKRRNNYIELTQFASTTERQMMGYGLKTINGKIIIVDGGTKGDATQLKNYIIENRWRSRNMVYNTSTFRPCRSI